MPTRLAITVAAIVLVLAAVGVVIWRTGLLDARSQPTVTEPPMVAEAEETQAATEEPIVIPATDMPESSPTLTRTPQPTATDDPTLITTPSPITAAATSSDTGTPEATEEGDTGLGSGLVPAQPSQMVLFGSDLPAGFQQRLNQQITNDTASGGDASRLAQLVEWGRLDGWETGYFDPAWCSQKTGVVEVRSYVSVYETAEGARSNYQYNISTSSRVQAGPISLGEIAHAEYIIIEGAACDEPATLVNYIIYFQWRNTYGSVSASGLASDQASLEASTLSYARTIVQRVMGWAQQ